MHQDSRHEIHGDFARTDPAFSPAPLWWWSGDRVTLPRLIEQLDTLADGGVHNLIVINLAPTGPNRGALADDPAFLSEEWWALWNGLVEHAASRGTRLWFYDQLGFSSAHLQGDLVVAHPEFAGAVLERTVVDVQAGEDAVLRAPKDGTPIAAWVSAVNGDIARFIASVPVEDGCVRWSAPAQDGAGTVHRVSLAVSRRAGFDYLSARACHDLIDLVHGEFERRLGPALGTTVAGSFQDELPSMPTWAPRFAVEFAQRCGYGIEHAIPCLFEDVGRIEGMPPPAQVRLDYQRVRAELAEEAFFRPLHDWHERHHLLIGCDQQGPSRAAEPLATVRQYADYLRTHRWFSAPGSDHHGDAKIHSSLAHHHGGKRVWIEAFHSSGWGSTLEETFDWLVPWILAGATLFDPHAVYYSTRGGWFEWAPPSSCWRQPYWRHYRILADTVSRLSRLLSSGRHVCSVGVLHPTATVQSATLMDGELPDARRAQECYLALSGRMAWYEPEQGILAQAGTDFDVLDEAAVTSATVVDGTLSIGAEAFGTILVPECRFLPATTAEHLVDLAETGGTVVIIGATPALSDSPRGIEACVRLDELIRAGRVERVNHPDDVVPFLPQRDIDVAGGLSLRRRVGDTEILVIPAEPTGTATRQPVLAPGRTWRDHLRASGYDFDPTRFRSVTTVRLPCGAGDIEQWDPTTGAAIPLTGVRGPDGCRVEVSFDRAPLAVVVWRPGGARAHVANLSGREMSSIVLSPTWQARLVPTTENAAGDYALPAQAGPLPVQQWRLDHQGPDSEHWHSVVVGYGTRAWSYGPAAAEDLPEPLPSDSAGSLPDEHWRPIAYSLSRGILKDPTHVRTLGPNGRVPEEFWHIEDVAPGHGVVIRTGVPRPTGTVGVDAPLALAVGANAEVRAWWNGRELPPTDGNEGYLRTFPLRSDDPTERNVLELRLTRIEGSTLRGYWALVTDAVAFRRPEWLSGDGERTAFRYELFLDQPVSGAVLQVATIGEAVVTVNDTTLATHGSYEPYGRRQRVQPYEIGTLLRRGTNTIRVHFAAGPAALLVDGVVFSADGSQQMVCTDGTWVCDSDTGTTPARPARRQLLLDGPFVQLRPRPHPLPRTSWIGDAADEQCVLPVVPEPFGGDAVDSTYRTVVPPGATSVLLPEVAGEITAHLDGRSVPVADGRIVLAEPTRPGRSLTFHVRSATARDGAGWNGPLEYECDAPGTITLGDWGDHGLGNYAGGVCYRQEVELPSHASAALDLGRVRGTAEVRVNERLVGARIWSPYRLDISRFSHAGSNLIEVTVFNTLAGYLDDVSPTPMVYPGQRVSGLFGPVRILVKAGRT